MKLKQCITSTFNLSILLVLPATATATSFQILEQSPAHLGKAFAGTASDVTDASSVYFNPAAIGELKGNHLTLGANAIFTRSEFDNKNSNTNGMTGKTDETGFVPNIYWTHSLAERLTFGLGINAPYGLASKYEDDWMGRYLATHSELEIINLNAVVAVQLGDNWSLGLGADFQRADVTLESKIDSTLGVNPRPATDSNARIQGDDDSLVADVSVYYKPSSHTSVGLVWRQGGEFDLTGDASFTLNAACSPGAGYPTGAPPAPTTGTICAATLNALAGKAKAQLDLPDTLTLSASHQLNEHWQAHADIAWTQWSNIQTIDVINTGNNRTVSQLELEYEDTLRYAIGFTHHAASPWTWRVGIAFDEAPQTDPLLLNPRIPDQDRTWFSAGFNYAFSTNHSFDVGYSHIKVDKAQINNTNAQTKHHVEGDFDASVNIIGVQANWKF